MAASINLSARELVGGYAEGEVLHADVGLSFWGGVNPLVTWQVMEAFYTRKGLSRTYVLMKIKVFREM